MGRGREESPGVIEGSRHVSVAVNGWLLAQNENGSRMVSEAIPSASNASFETFALHLSLTLDKLVSIPEPLFHVCGVISRSIDSAETV